MYGDLDYSGSLTAADANIIQSYTLGIQELSNLQKILADCNHDGEVNLADAIYIYQLLA